MTTTTDPALEWPQIVVAHEFGWQRQRSGRWTRTIGDWGQGSWSPTWTADDVIDWLGEHDVERYGIEVEGTHVSWWLQYDDFDESGNCTHITDALDQIMATVISIREAS